MTMRWLMAFGLGLLAGVAAAQEIPALKSQKDKLSYAIGVQAVRNWKRQEIEVDPDLVVKGLKDALSGQDLLMSEDELRATLNAFQQDARQKQARAVTLAAADNMKAGEKFLADNKVKEGVVTLPSGLQYKILAAGDGKKPTVDDKVVCHYRGTLIDGTEFDSSYRRNQAATFAVNRVIKGWTEALQLMPVGSRWQLVIPPQLAYGARGTSGIGPNATLIFEVDLISIEEKS